MAAESGRLLAGQGKRSKASQMKSPEKKKARKSTSQAAGFSHLTEFAPPPTPMVDHLVASNPFDDDFGPPSRPSGAGGPGPFLPRYGGGGRMGGGMGFMGGPGGPGGAQPGRRPPFGPASNAGPHHQFNMPPNFSPPMHPGPGFNPMLSPGGGPPPGPQQQQQLSLNPNGPPPPNTTPGPPPNSGPPQPGGGFPGHHDVQQTNTSTPGQPPSGAPTSNPNSSPPGPLNGSAPPSSAPGSTPYNQQNNTPSAGGPVPGAAPNPAQNNISNNNGGNTPGGNPNPPSNSTSTPNTQSPLPPGPAAPCGLCMAEVHDDQDAICEASCQQWFHRDCTGLTEPAYGLTRESAAVWACDFCIKTKDIQAVFVRQGLGQLVAANES
uniref:Pygopus homolog 2 (Drosophila) n=1 Tax=Tetraodon nigroviridis TaxID=99883 RepID=H3DJL2_TETNG